MSDNEKKPLAKTSKRLFIFLVKTTALIIAFFFRVLSLVLGRMADLLERATGSHDTSH